MFQLLECFICTDIQDEGKENCNSVYLGNIMTGCIEDDNQLDVNNLILELDSGGSRESSCREQEKAAELLKTKTSSSVGTPNHLGNFG